jgi:hypothetical protein
MCVSHECIMYSCGKMVTHSEQLREPAIKQILSLIMPIAVIGTQPSGQMTELSRINSSM